MRKHTGHAFKLIILPPDNTQMMYKWIGNLGTSRFISDASWLVSLNETQSAGLMK